MLLLDFHTIKSILNVKIDIDDNYQDKKFPYY